ncbi:DNA recombination protein RmuC [Balneatrix alpica]|uniref:DNA recombination protein RmuC n=1 Tax=Balneatrix alpica TaxID=75684 RepID=A0ABV5ZEI7_9GAMM|nr:DNA recombination protein RmuC [Balneatrix alpica]
MQVGVIDWWWAALLAAAVMWLVLSLVQRAERQRLLSQFEQLQSREQERYLQLEANYNQLSGRSEHLQEQLEDLRAEYLLKSERMASLMAEKEGLQRQLELLQQQWQEEQLRLQEVEKNWHQSQRQYAALEVRYQEVQRQAQEKLQLLQQAESQLSERFENLANRIFQEKAERFSQQNRDQLDSLLQPLKEQLGDFRQQVQNSYEKEAFERRSLKQEIQTLQSLNQRMSEEALNLTRALKGDKKLQGNWGEMVLARVLAESGLRQGHEYHTQVALKNAEGKDYQPDVVVHLPDQKDIVIDSKVSLVDYERYHSSDDESERQSALRRHVQALRNHIRALGGKDYQQLQGLRTLDYVLMFVPIEAAFMVAMEEDPSLFQFGLEHNILLVSPANLLVVLRTINHIWQYERQNQNAQLIAQQAAALYDKLRGFAEDMQRLGQQLEQSQQSYERAMNRFSRGRGNLVARAQRFVELGARPTKPLPAELLAESEWQLEQEEVDSQSS